MIFSLIFLFSPSEAKATNSALSFDGTDDYVLLPQINIGSVFSLEGWFYLNNPSSWRTLFKDSYLGNNLGSIYIDSYDEFNILEWSLNDAPVISTTAGGSQTWQYFSLIANGTTATIYLNGIEVGTANSSPDYNNTLEIGKSDGGTDWDGKVDEVRLYNRALSETEVAEHYQWTFNNESGLKGLWHFNEGSGTVANDSSGNNYNGIIYNATWADGPTIPTADTAPEPTVARNTLINNYPSISFDIFPKEKIWSGG